MWQSIEIEIKKILMVYMQNNGEKIVLRKIKILKIYILWQPGIS